MTEKIKIDLRQENTILEGKSSTDSPVYCVNNTVLFSRGIAKEIFVKNVDTDELEHVATVWHMNYVFHGDMTTKPR